VNGRETEDLETEEARKTATFLTLQSLERDAPRTAWSKMLQPHEDAADSSTVQNLEQNIPKTDWYYKSQPR
jgi:hypothetical protein